MQNVSIEMNVLWASTDDYQRLIYSNDDPLGYFGCVSMYVMCMYALVRLLSFCLYKIMFSSDTSTKVYHRLACQAMHRRLVYEMAAYEYEYVYKIYDMQHKFSSIRKHSFNVRFFFLNSYSPSQYVAFGSFTAHIHTHTLYDCIQTPHIAICTEPTR